MNKISSLLQLLLFLSVLLSFNYGECSGQAFRVTADNQPLDQVLIKIRDLYQLQLSFNQTILSGRLVTVNREYYSPEEAIMDLAHQSGLIAEKNEGVYIIFQPLEKKSGGSSLFYFSGQIVDDLSGEPLPLSAIMTQNNHFFADAGGNFSFRTTKPLEKIIVSHVGYSRLDTLMVSGKGQLLSLKPADIGMEEVIVSSEPVFFRSFVGEKAGFSKINHQVANYIPSNQNNTLLNILRLQPGILAAAEQSGDYIIRGSYRGQVLLKFDHIPLFSSSSLNNEIGIINPLMVNDIEIYKGAYPADIGGRVGGVINMTGKAGNPEEFSANFNLNTQTVSQLINIPVNNQYSVLAAYRQSYTGVFNNNQWSNKAESKLSYIPSFTFSDLNLKITHHDPSDNQFAFSFIGNKDQADVSINDSANPSQLVWSNQQEKEQIGASLSYFKQWDFWGKTAFISSFSELVAKSEDNYFFPADQDGKNPLPSGQPPGKKEGLFYRNNTIRDIAVRIEHQLPTYSKHTLLVGTEFKSDQASFAQDTLSDLTNGKLAEIALLSFFVRDQITINSNITINPSLKIDYSSELNGLFLQPQFDAILRPDSYWSLNLGWSQVRQYVSEIGLIDEFGNRYFYWDISNNSQIPIVTGTHYLFGVSYFLDTGIISVEGFYNEYSGLTRFTFERKQRGKFNSLVTGEGRSFGLDTFIKHSFGNHEFWLAYTLSRAEELFPNPNTTEFERAPQDQTHEIKLASIFNFDPWYLSMNYVYGSGLYQSLPLKKGSIVPYHRYDIAILFKYDQGIYNLETGVSILNLFDNENVGFNGFSLLPGNEKRFVRGIPFTPSVFVNIRI